MQQALDAEFRSPSDQLIHRVARKSDGSTEFLRANCTNGQVRCTGLAEVVRSGIFSRTGSRIVFNNYGCKIQISTVRKIKKSDIWHVHRVKDLMIACYSSRIFNIKVEILCTL